MRDLISSNEIPDTIITDLPTTAMGLLSVYHDHFGNNHRQVRVITFGNYSSLSAFKGCITSVNYPLTLLTEKLLDKVFALEGLSNEQLVQKLLPTIKRSQTRAANALSF